MADSVQQPTPPDPMAPLFRMSTTAGAAAADYVAISPLAVASAVMGLATALAIAFTPLLLVGAGGIICGLLALRQIRNSNGTQTGRVLAWAGIALSLVIGGGAFALSLAEEMRLRPDKERMNAILAQLERHIKAADYPAAYGLFDPVLQAALPVQEFERIWRLRQDPNTGAGKLLLLTGNNVFEIGSAGEGRIGITKAVMRFEKSPGAGRWTVVFRERGPGTWKIVRIEDIIDPRPAVKRR